MAPIRLAFAQGTELAALGAHRGRRSRPGWLRSEMMLEHYGVTEANWLDATARSPTTRSRPLRHLRDARRSSAAPSRRWPPTRTGPAGTGSRPSSGQLAQVYGFTDVDGSRPDAWRYLVEVQDAGKPADVTGYR